jgi:hypothetical protein
MHDGVISPFQHETAHFNFQASLLRDSGVQKTFSQSRFFPFSVLGTKTFNVDIACPLLARPNRSPRHVTPPKGWRPGFPDQAAGEKLWLCRPLESWRAGCVRQADY